MNFNTQKQNELLRYARQERGWSQQRVAEQIGTSEDVVSRWERGERSVSPFYQEKLCILFGKNAKELGFLKIGAKTLGNNRDVPNKLEAENRMRNDSKNISVLESSGFFSFGKKETALVVIDGNGIETYLPQNIRTFYDPRPVKFIDEIEQMREKIEEGQLENEINGKSQLWNGAIYHLANHILSRDPIHEQMKLSLWFRPTDYYTVLAKNRCLKETNIREKYISNDWEIPLRFFPIPFGIGLSLITADGYILLAQRKADLGVRPGYFMTSVEEGLSRPLDRGSVSDAPDIYRCACRGLFEELGLIENSDFFVSDIIFLALGLDTEYYMCGLRGLMKLSKTASEIIKNWQIGVKDKMENKKLFAVPFTPEDVCEFIFSHEPWGGGALMGIYHTLVHEFGKERVNVALSNK